MVLHPRRPQRPLRRQTVAFPRVGPLRTALAVLGGFLMALSIAGTGHADPSPAELEAQIDDQWNKVEPIMEEQNKVSAEIAANDAKIKALEEKLKPQREKVAVAMSKVSLIATAYYRRGNTTILTSLLSTGSPATLSEELTLLNQLSKQELSQVGEALEQKRAFEAEKRPLDELVAEQTKKKADLDRQKAFIDTEIKRLNDMRIAAFGDTKANGPTKLGACPDTYSGDPGSRAARAACDQIGKKYVWSTAGPNTFDCSGLTLWAWDHAGVNVKLRHYTNWQWDDTKRINAADRQVGDLIFFYKDLHHVGIYVGNNMMVHAPHTGDVVRMKVLGDQPIAGYGRPKF